jgi:lipoyl(octanoyl) transferase
MKVRRLNRGGSTLVHAPGQLAIYPILPLNRLGINLSEFRSKLLNSAIQACSEIRVPAYSREDAPGLWCRTGQFGYIGAAVKSWVSYHGMFLNVNPNLDLLRMVISNPVEHRPTSLTAQKTRRTSMHSVRENIARQLTSQFQYNNCHYYTGHPLLSRTRRKVYVNA